MIPGLDMNTLFYGDNLEILRMYVKDESVDLIYLDPPFNSKATYNILFSEKDGSQASSQIRAFDDTWTWGQESEVIFSEIVTVGDRVADCLQAFRTFLGSCNLLAYLVMMAPRLVELRRVLKPTGSIYLHCDPTASHYLKILMDAVFGTENYRNELIWKRKSGRGETNKKSNRFGQQHDIIFLYGKTNKNFFESQFNFEDAASYIKKRFTQVDAKGRKYRKSPIVSPNYRPNLIYEYKGYEPPPNGWSISQELMKKMDENGDLVFPKNKNQRIERKQYLDEYEGRPVQSIWLDIPFINPQARERLGYQTQKPVSLLERIIKSSCPDDGIVLDPFCGCGTTIDAAQKLGRKWMGIDITQLAITLIKKRLSDSYGSKLKFMNVSSKALDKEVEKRDEINVHVIGEPVSVEDAKQLAQADPYQFQWWALGLVEARPVEKKKGADKGIDGKIVFQGNKQGIFETVILSVKAGQLHATYIRDLEGVVTREKAAIGVLISMYKPTSHMVTEAATAGFYESTTWNKKYPKIQIITVEELLEGKRIEMPPVKHVGVTFKRAPKAKTKKSEQKSLF